MSKLEPKPVGKLVLIDSAGRLIAVVLGREAPLVVEIGEPLQDAVLMLPESLATEPSHQHY